VTTPDGAGLRWAPWAVLFAGLFLVVLAAVHFAPDDRSIATFYAGVALTTVMAALMPPRWWAVILAAAAAVTLAANLVGGRELDLAVLVSVTGALEALLAAWILSHGGRRRPRLRDQEDFARLLTAAVVSALLVAVVAGAVVWILDRDPGVMSAARTTFATHATAILVLVPVALATPSRWTGGRYELAAQISAVVGISVMVFLISESASLTFLPVVILGWAAVRFDLRVIAGELACFGVFVTALTVQGAGPFARAVASHRFDELTGGALSQGYLACATLLLLPLGIAVQHGAELLDRVTSDERLFRRNFTESLVGMAFLETVPETGDLVIVELNDTAVEILGGDAGMLVGTPLAELVDTGPDLDKAMPSILSGKLDGWRIDAALIGPRPGRVTLALSLLSEPGDAPVFAAQLLDVTSEYEARRGLEVAQQLTSATLDTTACIILVTDLDGVVVRVNAATTDITGYPASELLGCKVWDTGITPSDAIDVEALFMWPNRSGVPIVRERDAVTRSGEKLRVVWNTNIVRDDAGNPMYAVMTGIDVTAERTTAGLVNHLMEASFTTALIGVDHRGYITVVNSGAQHMLGFETEELIGQPFHRLLVHKELLERTGADNPDEAFEILVRGLGNDGETRARDWTWLTKSGSEQLVSMTFSVSQDAFAAQSGYLCVARDVTEQRHSQETLVAALDKERTAVEQLRALDQAKNEFVSTVSHELRTPVTSIVGYTEMLMDGSMVEMLPDQKPLLETINRNGQRLIVMINDLLMLSGLDADRVEWRRDPVDLAETLRPVEESIRPLLNGRDLELKFDPPGRPVPVTGDRAQLERVLINLLSNAVKFTEDGGTIRLSLDIEDGEAVLRVSDTGIGIPVDEQEDLFQRFFRSSTAQSRQIQGTGLGLSIVNAIVNAHGGRIDVESAHLAGTTFTVHIPLARSERLTAAG
jgi:PAS domain S-box-containing protein